MSLPLLVLIVVGGIAAVVIAVHLTGGSEAKLLDGPDDAKARFTQDFPDLKVGDVWITADGRSALLEAEDGRIGVVHALGRRFLTRLLEAGDLAGSPRASGTRLALRLRDFTWPGGVFEFSDAGHASAVEALFARQRSGGLWRNS